MLVVLALAASAARAVIAYNRARETDPEHTSASLRRVHQLAAVIVAITTGGGEAVRRPADRGQARADQQPQLPVQQLRDQHLRTAAARRVMARRRRSGHRMSTARRLGPAE